MSIINIEAPKGPIKGSVELPLSKSISNRAVILAYLNNQLHQLPELSNSDDTKYLLEALKTEKTFWFAGEGGTTSRFLLAAACAKNEPRIIDGDEQIRGRPVEPLLNALSDLGFSLEFVERAGRLPVKVKPIDLSNLKRKVEVDVSKSSQFFSALLLIAPFLPNGLIISWTGQPVSKPYIEMTLSILQRCGVIFSKREGCLEINPGINSVSDLTIESDWSAASYWYELISLSRGSEISLNGLTKESSQGDSICSEIFENFGVSSSFTNTGVIIRSELESRVSRINLIDHPDLAPALVCSSVATEMNNSFYGLDTLEHKETDRVSSINTEISKLGWHLKKSGEIWMVSQKQTTTITSQFNSHGDHRIAMCLAPLALKYGRISISNPKVVSKSYPKYFEELKRVGFNLQP